MSNTPLFNKLMHEMFNEYTYKAIVPNNQEYFYFELENFMKDHGYQVTKNKKV